jgi:hypothetical protein
MYTIRLSTTWYSIGLHGFCAKCDTAPGIFGFKQFQGGWFVVYILQPVHPSQSPEFSHFTCLLIVLDSSWWIDDLQKLMQSFHDKDLVTRTQTAFAIKLRIAMEERDVTIINLIEAAKLVKHAISMHD